MKRSLIIGLFLIIPLFGLSKATEEFVKSIVTKDVDDKDHSDKEIIDPESPQKNHKEEKQ